MKIETIYKLTLNEEEAVALKKVLGGLNNEQFSSLGVMGDDRARMSEIYNELPFEEEDS